MGNVNNKLVIKKREYKVIDVLIPFSQLSMIRVLQREFNYEVKGTIYVDSSFTFKSFEVRTDSSELYSYGASDWRISYHTHPDKTAQKYGIRYFSPPSVDDILEIYDYSLQFVPDTTKNGFGEISIIFANEGLYILQVNRDSFKKFNEFNLPIDGLEAILAGTLTEFLVSEVKKGIAEKSKDRENINYDNPDISLDDYVSILNNLCIKVSESYGLDMSFYSWNELEKNGLVVKVYDYHLNKVVAD